MFISIILWFLFGLISGFAATALFYKGDARQLAPLIILGIVGAFIGGSFGQIVVNNQTHFNFFTPLIALIGAAILIGLYKNISPQS